MKIRFKPVPKRGGESGLNGGLDMKNNEMRTLRNGQFWVKFGQNGADWDSHTRTAVRVWPYILITDY